MKQRSREGFGIALAGVWANGPGGQGHSGKGQPEVEKDTPKGRAQCRARWSSGPKASNQCHAHSLLQDAFSLQAGGELQQTIDRAGMTSRSNSRCPRIKVRLSPQHQSSGPSRTEPRLAAGRWP